MNRKGNAVTGETIKWILYLAILIAAGFAIRHAIVRFTG